MTFRTLVAIMDNLTDYMALLSEKKENITDQIDSIEDPFGEGKDEYEYLIEQSVRLGEKIYNIAHLNLEIMNTDLR